MNCRQAQKWMDAACDEPLTGARAAALDAHLAACPACAQQWRLLRMAEAALRLPQPVAAPEGMLAEFRRRVAAEAAQQDARPARPRPFWMWPAASFGAAAALGALVLSTGLYPGGARLATAPPIVPPAPRAPEPFAAAPGPMLTPALGSGREAPPARTPLRAARRPRARRRQRPSGRRNPAPRSPPPAVSTGSSPSRSGRPP
jgi:hypothetical protein